MSLWILLLLHLRHDDVRRRYGGSPLTRAVGGGEIEARDLAASVAQDADQLALVRDAWTQPADGVGVHVAGDGGLPPGASSIFLPWGKKKFNGI